jgi:hypothetical protein
MKDREVIQLIVAKRSGEYFTFETEPDSEIVTKVPARLLCDAIVRELELNGHYELYIRVPDDFYLNRLNLDSLDTVLLVPIDVEAGPIFRRRR